METTKTIIVILGVFFLINFVTCKKKEMEIPQANLGRGINLGNALEAPQEGEWGIVIQEYFFDKIKDVGFKAVRIPIRWSAPMALTTSSTPTPIWSQILAISLT